jgi:hypothetical protein
MFLNYLALTPVNYKTASNSYTDMDNKFINGVTGDYGFTF